MANRTPTADDHTRPTDVPGSGDSGDGAPALSTSAQADPTPAAATPSASAETHPRDGDGAGAGRPTSIGHRLAGLGVAPAAFLEVLRRRPLGRTQQRLDRYLADAHDLGLTGREAHLALLAVESTIVALEPGASAQVNQFALAGEVLEAWVPLRVRLDGGEVPA